MHFFRILFNIFHSILHHHFQFFFIHSSHQYVHFFNIFFLFLQSLQDGILLTTQQIHNHSHFMHTFPIQTVLLLSIPIPIHHLHHHILFHFIIIYILCILIFLDQTQRVLIFFA